MFYKALFVGEPKAIKTRWKSRDDAAHCIVRDGLSVTHVYESEDGRNYFDKSHDIAILLSTVHPLPANVIKFVQKHA